MLKLFRHIGQLVGLARENSNALDKAKEKYEAHGTLPHILDAYVGETGHRGDDALVHGVMEGLMQATNTLENVAQLLMGVGETVDELSRTLHEIRTRPLIEVIEAESHDCDQ